MASRSFTFSAAASTGYVIPLGGNFATVKVSTDQTIIANVAPFSLTAPLPPAAQPIPVTGGTVEFIGITSTTPHQFGDFAVTPGQPYDLYSYLVIWCNGTSAILTIACH